MDNYLLPSHQEEQQHGNTLSPYALYHCVLTGTASQVLLHWHEEAEFAIIRSGQANYQIGADTYAVSKGDLLLIAPNTPHSITPVGNMPLISDTIVFHLDLIGYSIMDQCTVSYLRPFFNGSVKLDPCMDQSHPLYHELYTCLDTALNSVTDQLPYHELLLKEKLNRIFYLLFQHGCMIENKISRSAAVHTEKVKQALLYIHENYKEPITVNQLAGLCNFSEIHFMNFFKKSVGLPCMEYIIQLRLKVAADLISTTDLSIAEIALECGFNNLSNFNRKFKSCYQQTPTEYRKLQIHPPIQSAFTANTAFNAG